MERLRYLVLSLGRTKVSTVDISDSVEEGDKKRFGRPGVGVKHLAADQDWLTDLQLEPRTV